MCVEKLERSGNLADKAPEVFLLSAGCLVEDVAGKRTCDLHVFKDKTLVNSLLVDVKRVQQLWVAEDCLIFIQFQEISFSALNLFNDVGLVQDSFSINPPTKCSLSQKCLLTTGSMQQA